MTLSEIIKISNPPYSIVMNDLDNVKKYLLSYPVYDDVKQDVLNATSFSDLRNTMFSRRVSKKPPALYLDAYDIDENEFDIIALDVYEDKLTIVVKYIDH